MRGWVSSPPIFESLLACWLLVACGDDFPELKAALTAFGELDWLMTEWPRESCSWEELRRGAPLRRYCVKDRRADAETSLLESAATLVAACSGETDYKLARIFN